jgi:hypothetical protein
MSDNALIIGAVGTGASWAFANSLVGTMAGALTCIYMVWRLYRMWKKKDEV